MLTVIFSSRNGSAVLPQTLEGFARAQAPQGGWKLVAVNNASTDETEALLRAYQGRLPLLVLNEASPGKNRALNAALHHAEGDLYVFCDDDVVVAHDWLVKWREAADTQTGYDLFAGLTRPLWPDSPPQWVLEEVDHGVVFGTNTHMREGPCDAIAMFGTNMAIRAHVFDKDVRFNADIGPSDANAYPMGSETELARRLAALGYKAWFVEAAAVEHIIRPRQLDRRAMLLRAYRFGRGQAHMRLDHHYAPERLRSKNRLRAALYPFLMPFYSAKEAWARQWEWATDQGYEDGWREGRQLPARWMRTGSAPRMAARFSRG